MHIIHFMKVSFFVGITHEPFQATAQSTSFPGPSPRSNKMADHKAGETRRLLRQCASSLLSACHRLEGGETESATTSLQTFANVTNPPTEPNRPVASSSHTAIQAHKNLFGFKPSAVQKSSTKSVKRRRITSTSYL